MVEHTGNIYAFDFSPDGQWMAATLHANGNDNIGLYVWKVDDLLKEVVRWWQADE